MVNDSITNECLESIINGLQPNKEDYILSICGSGDQAFTLASKGSKVLTVDTDLDQIEYAKSRYNFLKKGNLNEFMNPKERDSRLRYIGNKNFLLSTIKKSSELDIEFRVGNIFYDFDSSHFSKIYLSNAFNYFGDYDEISFLSKSLKNEGLIYSLVPLHKSFSNIFFKLFNKIFLDKLILQEELTNIARESYNQFNGEIFWRPYVYRKI